ncbi:hypothetical protein EMIT0P291_260032 [Pseudomonas sp. IT-P291]
MIFSLSMPAVILSLFYLVIKNYTLCLNV